MNLMHVLSFKVFDVISVYFKNFFFQSSLVLIMTLVVSGSFAAPVDTDEREKRSLIEYEKKSQKLLPVQSPAKVSEEENKDDEAVEYEKEKYFFKYQSGLTFRMGAAANFKELNKTEGDKKVPISMGFNFMLPSQNSKHQEYGLDMLSGNKSVLYIHGGYKFIIDHTSNLRPYYKIGAALRFDEGDGTETPFDFKSYSLVGSLGLEDLIRDPHSLRVDLDIFWGKEDFLALVSFGWTWAF